MKSKVTSQYHRPLDAGFGPIVLAILFGFGTGSTTLAGNEKNNPEIFKQGSRPYGLSYGEWAARWQQWVFSIPAATNPLLDETGAYASIGQSGPVWFLAGNFGGESVRTITVPHGKALCVPVLNLFFVRTLPEEPSDLAGIGSFLRQFLVDPYFSCVIDGASVVNMASYYTESPLFDQTLQPGNLFELDPGVYSPAMTIGYYLMVKPLKKGTHTIHIVAGEPAFEFGLDVTYNITVE